MSEPFSEILAGGEWVRRGMVWHWRPNSELETGDDPEPPTYAPRDLIACPVCLARMDEHCRTKSGRGKEHRRRLVKRVCGCGGPIRPREPMCGFCRAEMAREDAA
jgi:hypothetical protein